MDHPKLLVASHIVPWAADKDIRGDPQNVMLLCPLHDRMFDAGLISLNDDFTVIVSKALDGYETAKRAAMSISGMKLSIPADFAPKLEYLQYHRQHVFKND
jgi:putative restriction endonuclease